MWYHCITCKKRQALAPQPHSSLREDWHDSASQLSEQSRPGLSRIILASQPGCRGSSTTTAKSESWSQQRPVKPCKQLLCKKAAPASLDLNAFNLKLGLGPMSQVARWQAHSLHRAGVTSVCSRYRTSDSLPPPAAKPRPAKQRGKLRLNKFQMHTANSEKRAQRLQTYFGHS